MSRSKFNLAFIPFAVAIVLAPLGVATNAGAASCGNNCHMPGDPVSGTTTDSAEKTADATAPSTNYSGAESLDSRVDGAAATAPADAVPPSEADDYARATSVRTLFDTSKTLTSNRSIGVRGSSINAYGSTRIHLSSGWWAYADFTNSEVHGRWYGTSPWNANQVSASANWKTSGISVSLSTSKAISFSGSGSDLTWSPGPVYNNWKSDNSWPSRITEKAVALYGYSYTTHVNVLLGSNWYGV